MVELISGQYYVDNIFHVIIIFKEKSDDIYWFYYPEEDRDVAYYEYELVNLGRY